MESLDQEISVESIDPVTGISYTLVSTPPADLAHIRPSPGMSAKEYALRWFWYLITKTGPPEFLEAQADMIRQTRALLPVLDVIVDEVLIKASLNEVGELAVSFWLTFPEMTLETPIDFDDPEHMPPSNQFRKDLVGTLYNSQPLMMAMLFYYKANRDELQQRAHSGQDGDLLTPPGIIPTPIIPPDSDRNLIIGGDKVVGDKILIGLNAAGQLFDIPSRYLPSKEEVDRSWEKKTGLKIKDPIPNYGIDLTQIQIQVMGGLLRLLTNTNYEGNLPPITREDALKYYPAISSVDELPKMMKYVKMIPVMKVGKRELVRASGMDYDNQGDVERAIDALKHLGNTQFRFCYTRASLDRKGNPEMDPKTRNYLKEDVQGVDTLFDVQTVTDNVTKEFKYYQVSPSAMLLDQKEKYFMLVPFGWEKEVKAALKGKKMSNYLLLFLLYLRYRFEHDRRQDRKRGQRVKPFVIRIKWMTLCKVLRMPEKVYDRQRARALKLLDDSYQMAVGLGYLLSFNRDEDTDTLVLNDAKFHLPLGTA